MLTASQGRVRATGIGASEIGAIMGVDPFKSAIDVWLRKTGRAVEGDGSYRTRAGHYLENPILNMFADSMDAVVLHPRDVFRDSTEGSVRHPDYPYILATPDGITIPRTFTAISPYQLTRLAMTQGHCVDAKNVSLFARSEWDGKVPASYHLQVVQQMDVTELRSYGYLAVLSGGQHFFYRVIDFDDEIADMIHDAATRFWYDYVLTDTPPPVDASEGWARWLERRLPKTLGDVVEANGEAQALIEEIVRARETAQAAEAAEALAENKLKALIGDHRGMRGRGWKATWTSPGKHVAWKKIAEELQPQSDLIDKHTSPTARQFRIECKGPKQKENDHE